MNRNLHPWFSLYIPKTQKDKLLTISSLPYFLQRENVLATDASGGNHRVTCAQLHLPVINIYLQRKQESTAKGTVSK